MSRILHGLVTFAISLGLVLGGYGLPFVQEVAAQSGPFDLAASDSEILRSELTVLQRVLGDVLDVLPKEAFDVVERSFSLGFDAREIEDWVVREVAWLPYSGALKGSRGVLFDMAGNTLDQSLLLAELLELAGYDVRLARADLPEEAARAFSASASEAAAQLMARYDPHGQTEEILPSLATDLGVPLQQFVNQVDEKERQLEELSASVHQVVESIASQIGQALPGSEPRPPAAGYAGAMRDYWWVQYAAGDAWEDAHTIAAGATLSGEIGRSATLVDPNDLPQDVRHLVTIRVVAERLAGGALGEAVAMSHSFEAREAIGVPMSLTFAPVSIAATAEDATAESSALREIAATEVEWLPILKVGDESIQDSSVYTDGVLNENPNLTLQSQRFRDATQAFGSIGSSSDADGVWTAAWIEYEIASPQDEPIVKRRQVFDVLGERARSQEHVDSFQASSETVVTRGLSLLGQTDILTSASSMPSSYVQYVWLREVHRVIEPFVSVLDLMSADDVAPSDPRLQAFEDLDVFPIELFVWQQFRMSMSAQRDVAYVSEPAIVSRHVYGKEIQGEVAFVRAIDIVHNEVGVLDRPGVSPREVRLRQGVVDTVVEVLANTLEAQNLEGAITGYGNAASLMYDSEALGLTWRALDASSQERVGDLGHSSDVEARMRAAIDQGRFVFAPVSTGTDLDSTSISWWEVDPMTGTTLGVGARGWGTSGEYAIIQVPAKALLRYAHAKTIRATIGCMWVTMMAGLMLATMMTTITIAFPVLGGIIVTAAGFSNLPGVLSGIFQQCLEVALFRAP